MVQLLFCRVQFARFVQNITQCSCVVSISLFLQAFHESQIVQPYINTDAATVEAFSFYFIKDNKYN